MCFFVWGAPLTDNKETDFICSVCVHVFLHAKTDKSFWANLTTVLFLISPGSKPTCRKRLRWRISMSGSVHRLIFTMPCWSCLQWGHFQASSGASWNESVKSICQFDSCTNKRTLYLYYSTCWNSTCTKTWADSVTKQDSNRFVLLLVCNYKNPVHHVKWQWKMIPTAVTEICTFSPDEKSNYGTSNICCTNSSRRFATYLSLNERLLTCQPKWHQLLVMLAHVVKSLTLLCKFVVGQIDWCSAKTGRKQVFCQSFWKYRTMINKCAKKNLC